MKIIRGYSIVTPLLLSLLLAACSGPGNRMGGRDEGGMGRGRESGGEARRMAGGSGSLSVVESVQEQLRATAEDLKLKPTQWPLWERYQEKVGALMTDMMRLEGYQRPNQTAVQQIGGRVNTVRNRLAALEEIVEAAERLYNALDAEQKKVADQRLVATVPALYSGLGGSGGSGDGPAGRAGRSGGMPGGRGPGGGAQGQPGRF